MRTCTSSLRGLVLSPSIKAMQDKAPADSVPVDMVADTEVEHEATEIDASADKDGVPPHSDIPP